VRLRHRPVALPWAGQRTRPARSSAPPPKRRNGEAERRPASAPRQDKTANAGCARTARAGTLQGAEAKPAERAPGVAAASSRGDEGTMKRRRP